MKKIFKEYIENNTHFDIVNIEHVQNEDNMFKLYFTSNCTTESNNHIENISHGDIIIFMMNKINKLEEK